MQLVAHRGHDAGTGDVCPCRSGPSGVLTDNRAQQLKKRREIRGNRLPDDVEPDGIVIVNEKVPRDLRMGLARR